MMEKLLSLTVMTTFFSVFSTSRQNFLADLVFSTVRKIREMTSWKDNWLSMFRASVGSNMVLCCSSGPSRLEGMEK